MMPSIFFAYSHQTFLIAFSQFTLRGCMEVSFLSVDHVVSILTRRWSIVSSG